MESIARLNRLPIVEIVDDERDLGNGVIVTLKKGWTFEKGQDNRVRGEDTVHEIYDAVKNITVRFEGPYDD